MATAISPAAFQTAVGEAYDALVLDNYKSAHKWLTLAQFQLDGLLVDTTTSEGTTDKLRLSLEHARQALIDAARFGTAYRFQKLNRLCRIRSSPPDVF